MENNKINVDEIDDGHISSNLKHDLTPEQIKQFQEEMRHAEELTPEESLQEMEDYLYENDWKAEAREIPLDTVEDEEEKAVLIRYLNDEPLLDSEREILRQVLAGYREVIREVKPSETLSNIEDNIQLVEDEQTFIELLDQQQKERTVTMYIPLDNGKEIKAVIDVNPRVDTQSIIDVQTQLGIFKDLTQDELSLVGEYQNGSNLTREEQAIAQHIQEKITEKTHQNQREMMIEFLAQQTWLHGRKPNPDMMREIYDRMDIAYTALLFQRVWDNAGLGDVHTERVFRTSD